MKNNIMSYIKAIAISLGGISLVEFTGGIIQIVIGMLTIVYLLFKIKESYEGSKNNSNNSDSSGCNTNNKKAVTGDKKRKVRNSKTRRESRLNKTKQI